MQTTTPSFSGSMSALIILGIIEAIIVVATFANIQLPWVSNARIALIALIVIGMAMCGMGMQIPQYGWMNPFNLVGIVIGVILFTIGLAAVFGIQLPFIADERAAILAMAALMIVKVVIAGVRGVVS